MPTLKEIFAALLPVALPALLSAAAAGTAWAAVHLGAFLSAKAKSSRAFAALAALNDLVMAVVQDVEASARAELLSRDPSQVLTKDEAARLKALAIAKIKADLGAQGLATLTRVLAALLGTSSLDNLIAGKVEQAVAKLPASTASITETATATVVKLATGTAPAASPASPG